MDSSRYRASMRSARVAAVRRRTLTRTATVEPSGLRATPAPDQPLRSRIIVSCAQKVRLTIWRHLFAPERQWLLAPVRRNHVGASNELRLQQHARRIMALRKIKSSQARLSETWRNADGLIHFRCAARAEHETSTIISAA